MDFIDKARNYLQNIARNVSETVSELEQTKDDERAVGEVNTVEVVQLNVYDLRKKKREYFFSFEYFNFLPDQV